MKNKGLVFLTVILIIAVIGLGVGLYLVFNQKQKIDDENKKLNQTITELKEQIEDTESMVDDLNELVEQLENADGYDEAVDELKDYVEGAFSKYLDEADGLKEYEIEKIKILNKDKIENSIGQSVFEFEDSIAAEVIYSVKPETDKYMEWTAGNGKEDGEWIRGKSACLEVANTTNGYTVMSSGTGW